MSSASSLVLDACWCADGVWRVVGRIYGGIPGEGEEIKGASAEFVVFDDNVPDYPPEHWHNVVVPYSELGSDALKGIVAIPCRFKE
jgi:hypothetical protein